MGEDQVLSNGRLEKQNIVESKEFINFLSAFTALSELDKKVFIKANLAIKNNQTDRKEFELFFVELLDINKKTKSIDYLHKIGFKNASSYYSERNKLFNISIPKLTEQLGNKFPFLKNQNILEFLEDSDAFNERKIGYQACFDAAWNTFWANWWNEGQTYAQVVFQQTISWCGTEYL